MATRRRAPLSRRGQPSAHLPPARRAVTSKKPIHMFVMDEKASITGEMLERDADRYAKLLRFRERVLKSHVVNLFTDLDDLEHKAEQTLRSLDR